MPVPTGRSRAAARTGRSAVAGSRPGSARRSSAADRAGARTASRSGTPCPARGVRWPVAVRHRPRRRCRCWIDPARSRSRPSGPAAPRAPRRDQLGPPWLATVRAGLLEQRQRDGGAEDQHGRKQQARAGPVQPQHRRRPGGLGQHHGRQHQPARPLRPPVALGGPAEAGGGGSASCTLIVAK